MSEEQKIELIPKRTLALILLLVISLLIGLKALLVHLTIEVNHATYQAYAKELLGPLIDGLAGAALVSIFTVAFVQFLYRRPSVVERVRHIPAKDIDKELNRLQQIAATYTYVGNAGMHFTSKTIPTLTAKHEGSVVKVIAQILNPIDSSACEQYAKMRNTVRSQVEDRWSPSDIREELLATLLSIALTTTRLPRFRFERISVHSEPVAFHLDRAGTDVQAEILLTAESGDEDACLVLAGVPNNGMHSSMNQHIDLCLTCGKDVVIRDLDVDLYEKLQSMAKYYEWNGYNKNKDKEVKDRYKFVRNRRIKKAAAKPSFSKDCSMQQVANSHKTTLDDVRTALDGIVKPLLPATGSDTFSDEELVRIVGRYLVRCDPYELV